MGNESGNDGLTSEEREFLAAEAGQPVGGHAAPRRVIYCSDGVFYGPGHPPEGYRNPYERGRPQKCWPVEQRGEPPPHARGEYRIRNTQGQIVRAGISMTSLRNRMRDYVRDGTMQPGYSFEYQVAGEYARRADILYHEGLKLSEHKPPLNVYKKDWG
jgi:hypothetical protein